MQEWLDIAPKVIGGVSIPRKLEVGSIVIDHFNDVIYSNSRRFYWDNTANGAVSLDSSQPAFKDVSLAVTDDDKIVMPAVLGQEKVIPSDVYNAANIEALDGTISNPTYPNVMGQLTYMRQIKTLDMLEQAFPGLKTYIAQNAAFAGVAQVQTYDLILGMNQTMIEEVNTNRPDKFD